MNILNILLNNIVAITGLATLLLFYSSKKRKSAAEAETLEIGAQMSEFSAMKSQIEHLSKELKDAYTTIEGMQDIIDKKRARILEVSRLVAQMQMKVIEAEYRQKRAEKFRCEVEECIHRQPPLNINTKTEDHE